MANLGDEPANVHLKKRILRCHPRTGSPRMRLAFSPGGPVWHSASLLVLCAVTPKEITNDQQNHQATGARTEQYRGHTHPAMRKAEREFPASLRMGSNESLIRDMEDPGRISHDRL